MYAAELTDASISAPAYSVNVKPSKVHALTTFVVGGRHLFREGGGPGRAQERKRSLRTQLSTLS